MRRGRSDVDESGCGGGGGRRRRERITDPESGRKRGRRSIEHDMRRSDTSPVDTAKARTGKSARFTSLLARLPPLAAQRSLSLLLALAAAAAAQRFDRVSDHPPCIEGSTKQAGWKRVEARFSITEEEEGRLPCAVHSDLAILSLFPLLIFDHPPLLAPSPSPLSSTLDILSPLMSHDETDTRYLQPYSSSSPSPGAQSSNNTRGNGDGPFDPGNTPPLVFAFIAIGFIAFGLIIAIVYKKCRPLPNSPEPHNQRSSVPIRRPSARKPRLWDVWISPNKRLPGEERTNVNDWDNLLVSPFSRQHAVVFVDQSVDEHPSPYQQHLHTLQVLLPLPLFVSHSNTFKVTSHDLFSGKTPRTCYSLGDRQKTQPSVLLSWSPCPNHPNT